MNDKAPHTMVDYEDGKIGYISADAVSESSATYAYMPLRNLPHLKLATAMREQGQVEVSVCLKGGAILMTTTGLTSRSITLRNPEA